MSLDFGETSFDGMTSYDSRKRESENALLDVQMSAKTSKRSEVPGTVLGDCNEKSAESKPLFLKSNGTDTLCNEQMSLSTNSSMIESALKDEIKEVESFLQEWKPNFMQSEAFESFFVDEMDQVLRDVLQFEDNLRDQKEQLRNRLARLSEILKTKIN